MDKGKRYRPNVAAIILSPSYPLECKVFIAQRHDISGAWQFPQRPRYSFGFLFILTMRILQHFENAVIGFVVLKVPGMG